MIQSVTSSPVEEMEDSDLINLISLVHQTSHSILNALKGEECHNRQASREEVAIMQA